LIHFYKRLCSEEVIKFGFKIKLIICSFIFISHFLSAKSCEDDLL